MKRTSILLACVLGYALAGAAQNLIQNGSFELPVVTSANYEEFFVGTQAIPGWKVVTKSKENVLIINSMYSAGSCNFHAKFGDQWLDLTGAGSNTWTTGVAQQVTTTPGHVYQLSFWVGNTTCSDGPYGTTSSVIVSITPGPTFLPDTNIMQDSNDLVWQQFSHNFTAGPGNSTTITFFNHDLSNDNINGLDNVVLTDLTALNCVQPPNTTMVAWYPFDELTGTSSANLATANTGTQHNGPLGTSAGEVAGAAVFNGINQYVQSPDSIVTNFGPAHDAAFCNATQTSKEGDYSTCRGNFSIDTWIYVDERWPSNVMAIVNKEAQDGFTLQSFQGYGLFLVNNSGMELVLELADGSASDYVSPNLGLAPGQWYHIAVTVDRLLPNGITWYLNGYCAGYPTCTTNNPTNRKGTLANKSPLVIGAASTIFAGGVFRGALDELEIHNRVLTPQEILDIYNAGQYGKCKP